MSNKPRYIKPANKLRQKMGYGGIAKESLKEAQEHLETAEMNFKHFAGKHLDNLTAAIKDAAKTKDKDSLALPIMQLKANGGMFRYDLISDIANIALRFIDNIEELDKDAIVVVKAHENTMRTILAMDMRGNGSNEGYALVKELDMMCRRYFSKHKDNKLKDTKKEKP